MEDARTGRNYERFLCPCPILSQNGKEASVATACCECALCFVLLCRMMPYGLLERIPYRLVVYTATTSSSFVTSTTDSPWIRQSQQLTVPFLLFVLLINLPTRCARQKYSDVLLLVTCSTAALRGRTSCFARLRFVCNILQ